MNLSPTAAIISTGSIPSHLCWVPLLPCFEASLRLVVIQCVNTAAQVLIGQSCANRIPQTGRLQQQTFIFSPFWMPLFLSSRGLSCADALPLPLPLLIRTPELLDESLITSFHLQYLPEGSRSPDSHTGGCEWGRGRGRFSW